MTTAITPRRADALDPVSRIRAKALGFRVKRERYRCPHCPMLTDRTAFALVHGIVEHGIEFWPERKEKKRKRDTEDPA